MNKIVDNYLDELNEVVTLMAVGVAFSAINALIAGTNLYKKNFTKAALRCKDLPDKEKALCMLRAKILSKNIQLQSLKSSLTKCGQVDKCKQKIADKIQKIDNDIKFLTTRFQDLKVRKYA
jgi:hypothetical protein